MGARHHLAVLRYRKVGSSTEEDWLVTSTVPVHRFDSHLAKLRRLRWTVVSLADVLANLDEPARDFPQRTALLTFDGGYRSFVDSVVPVLVRKRYPSVLFVASDMVGRTVSLEPDLDQPEPICTWDELRALEDDDVAVGSLGVAGRDLSEFDQQGVEREIVASKEQLEEKLEREIPAFAYPNGDAGEDPGRTAETVRRAGYRVAFGTSRELHPLPSGDPFGISRITVAAETDLTEILE